jgi:hypothetical protein
VGVRCDFSDVIAGCTPFGALGVCTWRLSYDCDGDGSAEAIPMHYTPFRNDAAYAAYFGPHEQPEPRLVVSPYQCFSFDQCSLPPDMSGGLPYNPHEGLPFNVTPCLAYDRTDCSP